MFVEQFEEKGLAQYSYAIGNRESGQIAIIDPRFDSDIYLKYAEQNGFVISHVFDTHIHADYVSGARYLAIRARAILVLSGHDKGERYEVKFPHKVCFDGDFIKIGPITLEVVHTPGHAPEHISLLAWENGTPKIFFSGDFLLVGSVGPPDFIEPDHTERQLHKLYDVIKEKLHKLSDSITIYPAHGPGFLYGMKIGDTAFSTLGQEWLTNPFLRPNISRDEFVALVLSHYVLEIAHPQLDM